MLTSYPPANLNRDDIGRPKTARMGGVERLRVSSQSLKRTWRTSPRFEEALAGNLGTRTKRLGTTVYQQLKDAGIDDNNALAWAGDIAKVFGALSKTGTEIEQLAHISPEEQQAVDALVRALTHENRAPTNEELDLLRDKPRAADIGLFGRMLAADPGFNIEAAAQVAHAITVHPVTVEDDYFTAVDDLNSGDEDMGAAHIGEIGFGAGLFYSYICINRDQLVENLSGDTELADRAIDALTEVAATVSPKGKQATFGSRAYASYLLAEKGRQQPRSLAVAFLKPVRSEDQAGAAIQALTQQRQNFEQVYGPCADGCYAMDAVNGEGSLDELRRFLKA
jgi:CRISPR system Cascade subunit CasC